MGKCKKTSINRCFTSKRFIDIICFATAEVVQLARMSPLQGEGCGFDSRLPLSLKASRLKPKADKFMPKASKPLACKL